MNYWVDYHRTKQALDDITASPLANVADLAEVTNIFAERHPKEAKAIEYHSFTSKDKLTYKAVITAFKRFSGARRYSLQK